MPPRRSRKTSGGADTKEGELPVSEITLTKARRPEKIGRRLYEYVREDGRKSYYADVELEDPETGARRQRRITLDARNRADARKAQAALVSAHVRGEVVAASSRMLRDVGEEWLAQLNVRPRTRDIYEYHLRKNIFPFLGGRKIQDVKPQDCAALTAWLRDTRKVSGDTQGGAWRVLNTLLTYAVWTSLIPSNPLAAVPRTKRPKTGQKEQHRFLSGDEIDRLLKAATDGYRPLLYVSIWTGLRQSEQLGLTWGDLDLREAKIHLTAQLSRAKEGRPAERVDLKTNEARDIDIDPELVAFLKEHKERAFGLGFAKETDFVHYTLPKGLPFGQRNAAKAFSEAAERAGLNSEGRRKLRWHDMRRTYASIMLSNCDGTYVAQQLGHSVAMLYKTYAGLFNSKSQAERGRAAIAAARQSAQEIASG